MDGLTNHLTGPLRADGRRAWAPVLIGIGANRTWQGRMPRDNVPRAAASLASLGQGVVLSPLYRSPAWPDPAAPPYVNAAALFASPLEPRALLAGLHAIEAAFGRLRSRDPARRYAPRTLDLDLLAVGDLELRTDELTLPHPRIAERDFVLLPLKDVAPGWVHPVTGAAVEELLAELPAVTARRLSRRD